MCSSWVCSLRGDLGTFPGRRGRWGGGYRRCGQNIQSQPLSPLVRPPAPRRHAPLEGCFAPLNVEPDGVDDGIGAPDGLGDSSSVTYIGVDDFDVASLGRYALDTAGYRIWAEAMEPTVRRLLGERRRATVRLATHPDTPG